MMELLWERERVRAIVSRLHSENGGAVTAEVQFHRTREGGEAWHLEICSFNLLSSPTKAALAKKLEGKSSLEDVEGSWGDLIEQVAVLALSHLREGDPLKWLDSRTEAAPVSYLLDPLLVRGQPTLIYGMGGTGKSYLAMCLGVIASLPWANNSLGLRPGEPVSVLYLDWETDGDTHHRRLNKIAEGADLKGVRIAYRRCCIPLAQDLEAIASKVMECRAKLVIIDSVGVACSGDLNKPEVALEMYRGIRALGADVTPLLIGHTAKGQLDDQRAQKTPFGSAYFENQARRVYELRADREAGDGRIEVVMFDRKVNDSAKAKPWGLSMEFADRTVVFRRKEVAAMGLLSESLSYPQRIEFYLKTVGKATEEQICAEVGIDRAQLMPALTRMKQRGQVERWSGFWGLLLKEPANVK